MRLIDADALQRHKQLEAFGNGQYEDVEIVYGNDIDNAPTVDAEPVRYAVWLTDGSIGGHCSICGEECGAIEWDNDDLLIRPAWDYCPRCGAKMIGGIA